jgi:hypothetical protein
VRCRFRVNIAATELFGISTAPAPRRLANAIPHPPPRSLAPDNQSLEFLADMYRQLLPLFPHAVSLTRSPASVTPPFHLVHKNAPLVKSVDLVGQRSGHPFLMTTECGCGSAAGARERGAGRNLRHRNRPQLVIVHPSPCRTPLLIDFHSRLRICRL